MSQHTIVSEWIRRVRAPTVVAVALAVAWVGAVAARTGAAATGMPEWTEGAVHRGWLADEQAAAPPGQQPPAPPAGHVGTAACLECHSDETKGFARTMHGRPAHPRSPAAALGCESCHGPGAKHAETPEEPGLIRAFLKMPPREVSETCLTCHARSNHTLFEGSAHDSRNLSCVTCHSAHQFKSERAQLKTVRELDTCATCHRDKIAKLDRSGHMPVREGKMQCSTCHNPHGSTNVRQLRKGDSIAEMCTSCHAEKRGPFLWEHAPTRDGCVTCHDPHGSSNERMLVAKPPILCQRCHVATRHPSTIYDGALIGSGATPICHSGRGRHQSHRAQ